MKEMQRFFPAGLALGPAFCNRVKEREELKKSILKNEHLVIVSPRRYGKTSLITQVIQENNLPYCSIDFLPATNQQYVKNAILEGVGALLPHILPKQKTLMKNLLSIFTHFNPKISFSVAEVGFSVEFSSSQPPPKSITDALLALDQVAQKLKKHIVILMDEFQQLSFISENHTIEASIRHAVERSKNTTYIFSGSDRHTLEQMFNDKNRPLYHLCKLIKIERIHPEDFRKFIQNAAKLKWGKHLPEETINAILAVTECHTYYLNYLCRQLWDLEKIPTEENIQQEWQEYIKNQLPRITDDVGRLSANQRAVLSVLVSEPTKEIFHHAFLEKTGLPAASIQRAIDALEKNNSVYKNEQGVFHALDPAIASYLRTIKPLFERR